MILRERTTYRDGRGRPVHIVGVTHERVDGLRIFWSIQGDHYAENGQRVFSAIIEGSSYVTGPRAIKRSLRPLNSVLTIVEEDTSPQAVAWWEGFTPSPKEVPPESKS